MRSNVLSKRSESKGNFVADFADELRLAGHNPTMQVLIKQLVKA